MTEASLSMSFHSLNSTTFGQPNNQRCPALMYLLVVNLHHFHSITVSNTSVLQCYKSLDGYHSPLSFTFTVLSSMQVLTNV